MRIQDIHKHTLITYDLMTNVSVLKGADNVFSIYPTNKGPEDNTFLMVELHEGPGGHIERAKIMYPEGGETYMWCANKSNPCELFEDILDHGMTDTTRKI